jgi:hypothetical protein
MWRRGRREDELAFFGIEFPVGNTKTVAGENTAGIRIVETV